MVPAPRTATRRISDVPPLEALGSLTGWSSFLAGDRAVRTKGNSTAGAGPDGDADVDVIFEFDRDLTSTSASKCSAGFLLLSWRQSQ
jgi:hypothetical protein